MKAVRKGTSGRIRCRGLWQGAVFGRRLAATVPAHLHAGDFQKTRLPSVARPGPRFGSFLARTFAPQYCFFRIEAFRGLDRTTCC